MEHAFLLGWAKNVPNAKRKSKKSNIKNQRKITLAHWSILYGPLLAAILLFGGLVWIHSQRPVEQTKAASAELVSATGKCGQCHFQETEAIVVQHVDGAHFKSGVSCLDCHNQRPGLEAMEHHGFKITSQVTSGACGSCHADAYRQFLRSRHAAPAWTAVAGTKDFTEEQIAEARKYHPKAMDRGPNTLAMLEGTAATESGCASCHRIGKPNEDGSVGSCNTCHLRHDFALATARMPLTCGSCHMGPDHAQIEIWTESKHGVQFHARRDKQNLAASVRSLSPSDMDSPTCATCHMSGLGKGNASTHDVGERLSTYLFASVSTARPGALQKENAMKNICSQCHSQTHIDDFYKKAHEVVKATNQRVQEIQDIEKALRQDGLLTKEPFDEEIEFQFFDYWHYHGRTAKHGAFMGGADFVQWHGHYELLKEAVAIKKAAEEIRSHANSRAGSTDDSNQE